MALPSVDAALKQWASRHELPPQWAVACSGGADSVALLRAAHGRWPGRVRAIHINHGLQAAAADFEAHVRALTQDLQLPLELVRVDARAAAGQSPEDAARQARYQALAAAAQRLGLNQIWLAQHQDDQLETVLLALSRGAGVAGLAAMPEAFERHGVCFARPLLSCSGQALRRELQAASWSHCEDPSNRDLAFTRNRLRHQVVPTLQQAFPTLPAMAARSAQHMAQAQRLLDALARQDLDAVGRPPRIAALQQLDADRQANALRHWLKTAHSAQPSSAQLSELLRQVAACQTRGHHIAIKLGAGQVRRDGACLHYTPHL
jgi:tRNA(Ile)-lysidine synthase